MNKLNDDIVANTPLPKYCPVCDHGFMNFNPMQWRCTNVACDESTHWNEAWEHIKFTCLNIPVLKKRRLFRRLDKCPQA